MIVCCDSIPLRAAIAASGRRLKAIMAASRPYQDHDSTTSKHLIYQLAPGLNLDFWVSQGNFGNKNIMILRFGRLTQLIMLQ